MFLNKKLLMLLGVFLLLIGVVFHALRPTQIGFINMRDFQYAEILEANKNPFIHLSRIVLREGTSTNIARYHVVYIFGMGLKINEVQSESIKRAISKGVKVYSFGSTSQESNISNLSLEDLEFVEGYFANGGRVNTKRLLDYSRRKLDGRSWFAGKIEKPLSIPSDVFFHLDKDAFFETFDAYKTYYSRQGFYKEGRPKVAVVSTNIGPRNANRGHVDMLISGLEQEGLNVYPLSGFGKRLEFLKQIEPDLVVLLPHGRFSSGTASEAVEWLKARNIPLISPVTVFSPYAEWVKDQRGMTGGMLSQSIVMPEIDGGISPLVFGAQYKNDKGLYVFNGVPDRVARLTRHIAKWIALKKKNNQEKLPFIITKGPGLMPWSRVGWR